MQFILAFIFFIVGIGVGWAALKMWANSRVNGVNNQIANKLKEAEDREEKIKQSKISEAKEEDLRET